MSNLDIKSFSQTQLDAWEFVLSKLAELEIRVRELECIEKQGE